MNKKCVCDENDEIALCDPQNRGLILTVSADYNICPWYIVFGAQDGLWGGFSKERKLVTHICPPGYCDCKRSFQNGSEDVGCRLEYNDPSTICDKTRTGTYI